MKKYFVLSCLLVTAQVHACDTDRINDIYLKNLSGHSVSFSGIRFDEKCNQQAYNITLQPEEQQELGLVAQAQDETSIISFNVTDPALYNYKTVNLLVFGRRGVTIKVDDSTHFLLHEMWQPDGTSYDNSFEPPNESGNKILVVYGSADMWLNYKPGQGDK